MTVIDGMLEIIPEDEREFRTVLNVQLYEIVFTPPERMGERWLSTSIYMMKYMSKYTINDANDADTPPQFKDGSWQEKVFKLWMDQNE